jgi:hypothetical protein
MKIPAEAATRFPAAPPRVISAKPVMQFGGHAVDAGIGRLNPMACLGLLVLLVGSFAEYREYRILHTWPTTVARVTQNVVGPSSNALLASRRYGYGDYYVAEIWFRYQVAGKNYDGSATSDSVRPRAAAAEIGTPYTQGAEIRIQFDPQNPRYYRFRFPIDLWWTGWPGWLVGIGAVVLLLAGLPQLLLLRSRSRRPPSSLG